MTKQKKQTIGELIECALRDPNDGLGLHEGDEDVRARVEWLREDRRRGVCLDPDDQDFLLSFALDHVFPGRPELGRLPNRARRPEAKARAQAKADAAAAAHADLRAYHDQIKPECQSAADAWERTATKARRDYQLQFPDKRGQPMTTRTITGILSRRFGK